MTSSNPDEDVILPERNDKLKTENETSFKNQRTINFSTASTATPTASELLVDEVDRDSESKSK